MWLITPVWKCLPYFKVNIKIKTLFIPNQIACYANEVEYGSKVSFGLEKLFRRRFAQDV